MRIECRRIRVSEIRLGHEFLERSLNYFAVNLFRMSKTLFETVDRESYEKLTSDSCKVGTIRYFIGRDRDSSIKPQKGPFRFQPHSVIVKIVIRKTANGVVSVAKNTMSANREAFSRWKLNK